MTDPNLNVTPTPEPQPIRMADSSWMPKKTAPDPNLRSIVERAQTVSDGAHHVLTEECTCGRKSVMACLRSETSSGAVTHRHRKDDFGRCEGGHELKLEEESWFLDGEQHCDIPD